MSEPMYHLFIVRGFREAFYQLSTEGRSQFWTRVGDAEKAAASKVLLVCNSSWCNERYSAWGMEEFPNLEAVQKMTLINGENDHFRYIEADTYLGNKIDGLGMEAVKFPNPLYQLWLVKNLPNEPWDNLSDAERDPIWEQVGASIRKNGGVNVIVCECTWSNEEFRAFGVIAWPNLAAEQAHFKDLAEIGWHRYTSALTILGTQV